MIMRVRVAVARDVDHALLLDDAHLDLGREVADRELPVVAARADHRAVGRERGAADLVGEVPLAHAAARVDVPDDDCAIREQARGGARDFVRG